MAAADVILPLARKGVPPRDIQKQTRYAIATIYKTICLARNAGDNIPTFEGGRFGPRGTYLSLDTTAMYHLQAEADRRGLTVAQLSARLIDVIDRDGLVGAILDDSPSQADLGCAGT